MKRRPCVVFDVDDTLYLERTYARSGFSAVGALVAASTGLATFGEIAWRLFEEGVRGDIFDRSLQAMGLQGSAAVAVADLVQHYRGHSPEIELLDDSRSMIADLVTHGIAMAAITDGPRESQHAKVRALGLAQWMDPIVVTADLGPGMGKPHPAAFELVQQTLNARGADLWYLADNPTKDFRAPRSLGWRTMRVRRPLGLHASVEHGDDVDCEVTSLADARSLVLS